MVGIMKRKYLLKDPMEVGKLTRLIAKSVDMFIVLLLSIFFYPLGITLSLIYISIADSLQHGQSVGKKLLGLSVISLEDGRPCSTRQSLVRNLPISIPLAIAVIPFIGWIFSIMIGTIFIGLEIYLLCKLDSGHRLGDVMADTSVMANDGTMNTAKNPETRWFESTTTSPIS